MQLEEVCWLPPDHGLQKFLQSQFIVELKHLGSPLLSHDLAIIGLPTSVPEKELRPCYQHVSAHYIEELAYINGPRRNVT